MVKLIIACLWALSLVACCGAPCTCGSTPKGVELKTRYRWACIFEHVDPMHGPWVDKGDDALRQGAKHDEEYHKPYTRAQVESSFYFRD